ncbi:unnamed protein product [Amoebophrya sp. A25]|nr:unnamed protein product [Amoebophrya sp. A25]|eukprot:GSA25T00017031001.1
MNTPSRCLQTSSDITKTTITLCHVFTLSVQFLVQLSRRREHATKILLGDASAPTYSLLLMPSNHTLLLFPAMSIIPLITLMSLITSRQSRLQR